MKDALACGSLQSRYKLRGYQLCEKVAKIDCKVCLERRAWREMNRRNAKKTMRLSPLAVSAPMSTVSTSQRCFSSWFQLLNHSGHSSRSFLSLLSTFLSEMLVRTGSCLGSASPAKKGYTLCFPRVSRGSIGCHMMLLKAVSVDSCTMDKG